MPEDTTTALAIPEDFAEYAGMGLEAIKTSDLVVPRVTLLQAMSPIVTAEDSEEKAGVIYNLTTSENLGKQVDFVLLNYWLSRTKWETKDPGAPIECVAPNGEQGSRYGSCATCEFANWKGNDPPSCTDFKNLIMLIKPQGGDWDDANWANYAAKRSALTPTNRLLTAVKTWSMNSIKMPIFAGIYQMSVTRRENKGGVFYTPEFKRTGIVPKMAVSSVHSKWKEFEDIRLEAIKVAAEQNASEGDEVVGATADGEEPPY